MLLPCAHLLLYTSVFRVNISVPLPFFAVVLPFFCLSERTITTAADSVKSTNCSLSAHRPQNILPFFMTRLLPLPGILEGLQSSVERLDSWGRSILLHLLEQQQGSLPSPTAAASLPHHIGVRWVGKFNRIGGKRRDDNRAIGTLCCTINNFTKIAQ